MIYINVDNWRSFCKNNEMQQKAERLGERSQSRNNRLIVRMLKRRHFSSKKNSDRNRVICSVANNLCAVK